jgi:D-alanyl-D-alanine carboxypeptidase
MEIGSLGAGGLGISYASGFRGSLLLAGAVGLCDMEENRSVTCDTRFPVASQTKMFTGVAALQLDEMDLLDIHEPIERYVPELVSGLQREIAQASIFDLLTHCGRFPRDFTRDSTSLRAALRSACSRGEFAEPPRYSNVAYSVLGSIIEMVSGMPYDDYVAQHVFRPLEMTRTGPWQQDLSTVTKQYGVLKNGRRDEVGLHSDAFDFPGAMNMWSTPSDMCNFGMALGGMDVGRTLLRPTNRKLMTSVHWGPEVGGRSFGLGLEVREMAGRKWFGHTGGSPGAVSATYFSLDAQICFSVAINRHQARVLEGLLEFLATASVLFAAVPTLTEQDRSIFETFEGSYCSDSSLVDIVLTPGTCVAVDPIEWNPFSSALELEPLDVETLRVAGNDFHDAGERVEMVGGTVVFGAHRYEKCIGHLH